MRPSLAILLCLTLSAGAVESNDERISVRGFADNNTANRMLGLARRCEFRIVSLLGRIAEPVWLHIYPVAELPLDNKDLLLGLAQTQHDWQAAPAIARALLHRRIDRQLAPLPRPEQVPEWLVAAVAHQVVTERGETSPSRRFPACRSVLANNKIPDLKILIDSPVAPASALFYQLYGEFCSALVLSIRRADREAVARILQSSVTDLAPSEIMDRELGLIAQGNLQGWWEGRLPATVFSIFNPITHKQAIAELQAAQTITVIVSAGEDGPKTTQVAMDSLTHRFRGPSFDPNSLDAAHIKLFNLLQNAPVTLRAPINAYLGALNALRDESHFTFSRRIRAAKRSLEANRGRGPEMQQELRALDHRKTYLDLLDYYRFFGYVPPTNFGQELREHLDTLERGPR